MNSGERHSTFSGQPEAAMGGQQAILDKVRLYEVAKDLGLTNKDLVERVRALGIEVKNHMSNLGTEDVARVKRSIDKERQSNLVEERLSSTVIRRRSRGESAGGQKAEAAPQRASSNVETKRREEPDNDRSALERANQAFASLDAKKVEPVRAREAEPVRPAPVERVEVQRPAARPPVETHAPAVEAKSEESATPEKPSAPEPVKYGPTGRMIELPAPRIEITQRDRFGAQNTRGVPVPGTQRREMPGAGAQRDRFGRQQLGKKKVQLAGKKQKTTQITTPAQHKRVIKMEETIAVGEIAKQMGIKATDVLKKLWSMGMTGITLNNAIDQDSATLLAGDFGFEIESTAFQEADVFTSATDNPEDLVVRAPVVTIMGHVDHGKTSLLDAIRQANVAGGEAGGITQHIGAYKVSTATGDIVFLDTPGHEAFTAMRARGAQVTDIVVLVVAADDGVMPTTIEAITHAKEAGVKIIVAVNKIDKNNAQPERIRQQLSDHGLISEQWGGDTIFADVSARNKTGIDQLLQMINLQAEILELRANPNKGARGHIIEARLDRNRGPMATVLIQDGTLRLGETVVAGEFIGKVRAMLDDKGQPLTEAGPSTPVELLGLSGVPEAGEALNTAEDEKGAKELIEHRRDSRRKRELAGTARVTLENLMDRIKEGAVKELKVILKADVQGSAEAVKAALHGLSTETVRVDVISSGVGGITETDVNLAKAGNAIIVGFHVRPAGKASQLAEQEGVDIKLYDIIYEALDDVKKAMAGLLSPVKREKSLGKAEIRQTFGTKGGTIAGGAVLEGLLRRNAQVRVVRDSKPIYTGKLQSLRRFKDDVREVEKGYECGFSLDGFNDILVGDIIEAFEIEEIAPTL